MEKATEEKNYTDNEIHIVSIKDISEYGNLAVKYIEENWPPVKSYFEDILNESIVTEETLPNTFLMLRGKNIIGFYQLLSQECIVRDDLSPWISCLFIDEKERGKRLSSQLLLHGRSEAGKLGYDKVYLTTDHIQFYEKFGFREIELSTFKGGRPTKIYEHHTIKGNKVEL